MLGPGQQPHEEMHFWLVRSWEQAAPTYPSQPLLFTIQGQTSTMAVLGHPGLSLGSWPCPSGASHGQWPLFSHQDSYSTKGNSLPWSTRDAGRTRVCLGAPAQTHRQSAVDILCCFPMRTESPSPPISPHSVAVKNGNIVRNRRGQDGPLFNLFDLKPGRRSPDLPS